MQRRQFSCLPSQKEMLHFLTLLRSAIPFEPTRVDNSTRSGGLIRISDFYNMKVCCVFSLESPHFQFKRENHPILAQVSSYGIFSQGLKQDFETAIVRAICIRAICVLLYMVSPPLFCSPFYKRKATFLTSCMRPCRM